MGDNMQLNIGLFNESFPPTIDGVANCVFNYAEFITENHGECTVVTPHYPHVVDNYKFPVYRYSSADISKSRIGYRVGNMFSVKTLSNLYSKHFDIIHVHSPFTSSVIANEIKKIDPSIPVIFTYHTKFDIDFKSRLKVPALCKAAERFTAHNISNADEVWVVSEGAVDSLRAIGYKGSYRVMKNGTDFKKGKLDELVTDKLRAEYGIDKDEKMFLFVGRMMWYKNVGLILDALKLLPEDFKFKMVFVGDGADREAVEKYAESLGLKDKTVFAGAVQDRERVRAFFSASDLFLFPSTYDTAGLVVMEAAACDLPSVLVEGSCAAEDVVDDFSGFLCKEDAKSMAQRIVSATADSEKLAKIGKNAAEYVYLSWEESVARAYKRYCEIYNSRRRPTKKKLLEKAMPENIKKNVSKGVGEVVGNVQNGVDKSTKAAAKIGNSITTAYAARKRKANENSQSDKKIKNVAKKIKSASIKKIKAGKNDIVKAINEFKNNKS